MFQLCAFFLACSFSGRGRRAAAFCRRRHCFFQFFVGFMAKERKFEKRGYLRYIRQNASGAYAYTGGYYALAGGGYGPFLRRLTLCGGLAAAAVIAGGIVPNPATRFDPSAGGGAFGAFYVIIPYILELAFTGSAVWAVLRLISNEKPLREYVYKSTVAALPRRAVLAAAAAGLAAAGETVYVVMFGAGGMAGWVAAIYALHAAAAAGALTARFFVKRSVWSLQPHP